MGWDGVSHERWGGLGLCVWMAMLLGHCLYLSLLSGYAVHQRVRICPRLLGTDIHGKMSWRLRCFHRDPRRHSRKVHIDEESGRQFLDLLEVWEFQSGGSGCDWWLGHLLTELFIEDDFTSLSYLVSVCKTGSINTYFPTLLHLLGKTNRHSLWVP